MSHKRPTAASAIRAHPRKDYASRIQLGAVSAWPCAPGWDARYRVDNAWSGWNSLGITEWDDAIFIAVDRLAEREQAAKAGVTPPTRRKRETNTVNEIARVIRPLGGREEGDHRHPATEEGQQRQHYHQSHQIDHPARLG